MPPAEIQRKKGQDPSQGISKIQSSSVSRIQSLRHQEPNPSTTERRASRIQRLWQQWRGSQPESQGGAAQNKLQGTIQAVHIGKRSDGHLMGCAYFRFECTEQMAQSMLQDQDNRLVGRSVLVDWQLPKRRHLPSCCW